MEETKDVSIRSVAIKYGLISGLIGIIYFVVVDFAGLVGVSALQWVAYLITAVLIFLAHKEYIRDGDGYMSYGQGLGLGTLLSLVSAVLSSVFAYFYISFINTDYIANLREITLQKYYESGMGEQMIEKSIEIFDQWTTPVMILVIGIISGVFIGFIISLIVSAITKKSRPEFA